MEVSTLKNLPETTDMPMYNISHYFVKEDALPDNDEGRDVRDASISTLASSSKNPNLLHVFTGSSCPLARLSLPPFFLEVPLGFEVGRDATGFLNPAALTHHAPATFTFPAGALRPEAEVPDLALSVGIGAQNWTLTQPQGSKSGAWEKNWSSTRRPRSFVHLQSGLVQCPGVGRSRP